MGELGNVEKIYQAVIGQTEKNEGDGSFFKSDFSRNYFLKTLTENNFDEALAWLKDSKNSNVNDREKMIVTLESAKKSLTGINESTTARIGDLRTNIGDQTSEIERVLTEKYKDKKYSLNGKVANFHRVYVSKDKEPRISLVISYSGIQLSVPIIKDGTGYILAKSGSISNIEEKGSQIDITTPDLSAASPSLPTAPANAFRPVPPAPTRSRTTETPGTTSPRTGEQVTDKNREFLMGNAGAIKGKLANVASPLKAEIQGLIDDPTNRNMRKLQAIIGIKKPDGDFWQKSIDAFLDWDGKDKRKSDTPANASEKQKITDPDKLRSASAVLASARIIKGLENVVDLKSLGFTVKDGSAFMPPEGLIWTDENDAKNFNVKLKDGYEVSGGAIRKKVETPKNPQGPKEELLFSQENLRIKEIVDSINLNINKKNTILVGRDYYTTNPSTRLIEYAWITQSDGDSYVWDIPINGTRRVYRLDKENKVKGTIDLDSQNKVLSHKGSLMNSVPYTVPLPPTKK